MNAASLPSDLIALRDVDDLTEADFEAELAERLEPTDRLVLRRHAAGAGADEVGRLVGDVARRPGVADAMSVAWAIRRAGSAAVGVHDLGLRAAMLAG